MFHAAIARPQKVVALVGVATAVDGLVTQFNQLPIEVSPRQPQCIPPVVLLLPLPLNFMRVSSVLWLVMLAPSFVLTDFLFTISFFYLTIWVSESHSVVSNCLRPHGILQAKITDWVAGPFSRRSSQPRDWTQVSRIAGRFFTNWATREAPFNYLVSCLRFSIFFTVPSNHCITWMKSYFNFCFSNMLLTTFIYLDHTLWPLCAALSLILWPMGNIINIYSTTMLNQLISYESLSLKASDSLLAELSKHTLSVTHRR